MANYFTGHSLSIFAMIRSAAMTDGSRPRERRSGVTAYLRFQFLCSPLLEVHIGDVDSVKFASIGALFFPRAFAF
jgi:hypothetical protein